MAGLIGAPPRVGVCVAGHRLAVTHVGLLVRELAVDPAGVDRPLLLGGDDDFILAAGGRDGRGAVGDNAGAPLGCAAWAPAAGCAAFTLANSSSRCASWACC